MGDVSAVFGPGSLGSAGDLLGVSCAKGVGSGVDVSVYINAVGSMNNRYAANTTC